VLIVGPNNAIVYAGSSPTVSCVFSDTPICWDFASDVTNYPKVIPVNGSAKYEVEHLSNFTGFLTVVSVLPEDSGRFSCFECDKLAVKLAKLTVIGMSYTTVWSLSRQLTNKLSC